MNTQLQVRDAETNGTIIIRPPYSGGAAIDEDTGDEIHVEVNLEEKKAENSNSHHLADWVKTLRPPRLPVIHSTPFSRLLPSSLL